MRRLSLTKGRGLAALILGIAGLLLVGSWVLKIRNIRYLQLEIAQAEGKLKSTQQLWKTYPPLTRQQRKEMQSTQERLFYMLPKDKDISALFEEISRLAREHFLSEVAISTEEGVAAQGKAPASGPSQVAPSAVAPTAPPKAPESTGPIDSFPLKVTFAGDYREIAYFLEALKTIPRVITIQSLQLRRRVPVVSAELVMRTYYQKENLPGNVK